MYTPHKELETLANEKRIQSDSNMHQNTANETNKSTTELVKNKTKQNRSTQIHSTTMLALFPNTTIKPHPSKKKKT